MDNGRIELAILRPDALPADVHKVATDVVQQGYAGVVVSPVYIARVATMLRGSGATVTATVNYPAGTSKPTLKAIEATSSIKDGADALLIVPHQPNVIRADFDAMRAELLEIVRAARATSIEAERAIAQPGTTERRNGERMRSSSSRLPQGRFRRPPDADRDTICKETEFVRATGNPKVPCG